MQHKKTKKTHVHPSAILEAEVILGEGTQVWHFSHLRAGARIGRHCVLGQNTYVAPTVVIGNRCRIQNNVSLFDGVELEEDVFIGPSAAFTNVLRPRAAFSQHASFKNTLIKTGATIGANATILCGITIHEFAMVGAGSVVTKDIPAYQLVVGNPARFHSFICQCGVDLRPKKPCERCGLSFEDVNI